MWRLASSGVMKRAEVSVVGYLSASLGLIDMRADQLPSHLETTLAGGAMDASVRRSRGSPRDLSPAERSTILATF